MSQSPKAPLWVWGLLVAAAEMSLSSGIGITIDCAIKSHEFFFGEDQGRYLIEIDIQNDDTLKKLSADHGVVVEYIGQTKDNVIEIKDNSKISIKELKNNHEKWFPGFTK